MDRDRRVGGAGGHMPPPNIVSMKKCLVPPNIESLMVPPPSQSCSTVPDGHVSMRNLAKKLVLSKMLVPHILRGNPPTNYKWIFSES